METLRSLIGKHPELADLPLVIYTGHGMHEYIGETISYYMGVDYGGLSSVSIDHPHTDVLAFDNSNDSRVKGEIL